MELYFSDKDLPTNFKKSLFLAGPSPRSAEVEDWRPEAVRVLRELGYEGALLISRPKQAY